MQTQAQEMVVSANAGSRTGIDLQTGLTIRIEWNNGVITSVQTLSPDDSDDLPYIAPGLIDLQINGWGGINFGNANATEDSLSQVARQLNGLGVTHFLPTLITNSHANLNAAFRNLAKAFSRKESSASVLGFHLEGPFLSPEDGPRGAHPREHCRPPDWTEFRRLQESAEGKIKLVTLAPELPGAPRFIEQAVASNVRVAIGHTAASQEEIRDAVDAGATLSTHLGNGAADQIQRHHNPVFDQLGEDRLFASLIVDRHHLPPHIVRIFARAKGLDRVLLVSDAVHYAGLPLGIYEDQHCRIEVCADGAVRIVDAPRLAGSTLRLVDGVRNFAEYCQIPLGDAWSAASLMPSRYLGLENRLGRLTPGNEASFLLMKVAKQTSQIERKEVFVCGRSCEMES